MASSLLVYAAEKDAGLYDRLQNNKVYADIQLIPESGIPEVTRKIFNDSFLSAIASKEVESFDLHRLYTILVTVGWNLNDDVFDPKEVWAARHSPEDKPFNLEHNPRQVIGHITDCVAVDDSYTVIEDGISVDSLPDKFHILTSAVVYKHIKSRDEKLTEETKELIAAIAENKWRVSMEAIFSDFDYALKNDNGVHKVIARNENTAFLTKHLRCQGGLGVYEGYKVGRQIKNITFSGKGLVKNPGNPESIIFNNVDMFKGVFASLEEIKPVVEQPKQILIRHYTKYSI